jgi:hypothetical protein
MKYSATAAHQQYALTFGYLIGTAFSLGTAEPFHDVHPDADICSHSKQESVS